jgi:hypothetical protein
VAEGAGVTAGGDVVVRPVGLGVAVGRDVAVGRGVAVGDADFAGVVREVGLGLVVGNGVAGEVAGCDVVGVSPAGAGGLTLI